jgi:3-deoxy-7-phosphoheptulonate synthase
MIIQLEDNIKPENYDILLKVLEQNRCKVKEIPTQLGRYILAMGGDEFDIRRVGNLAGVKDVHAVNDKHLLVSSKWKTQPTSIRLEDNLTIGGGGFSIIAGPCSIENKELTKAIADYLKQQKIPLMRGGVFKPRSSPYSFRGTGLDGLTYFSELCRINGIKVVTEVMQPEMIDSMYPMVDIFQVGARNSQNYNLLDELGRLDKPVLLKRGLSGTMDELLYSAEYVFSGGNERIILCERGIRTFEKAYRNTLDLNIIPFLRQKTHLPVIVDPSHGTGIRSLVEPMTLAAVMAGADGALIEIHPTPEKAMSDGQQSLSFEEMSQLTEKINRTIHFKKSELCI